MVETLQSNEQSPTEENSVFCVVGWVSVALGIIALGVYAGYELRLRHKFNTRTQYDIFSHAGDPFPAADYGVGI